MMLTKKNYDKVIYVLASNAVMAIDLSGQRGFDTSQNSQVTLSNVTLEEFDDGHIILSGSCDFDKIRVSSNNWCIIGNYEV